MEEWNQTLIEQQKKDILDKIVASTTFMADKLKYLCT